MARFFTMSRLICFPSFSKKNKVKIEPRKDSQDVGTKSVCMDVVIDSEQHKLSTNAEELKDLKDSMMVKSMTEVFTNENGPSGSTFDQNKSHSVVGLVKGQFNGSEVDSGFRFEPLIGNLCNETPVETAYEAGDEQEILSTSRDLSDHECQRNIDTIVRFKDSEDIKSKSSHEMDLFGNSEVEFNHKCENPQYNEEMLIGHLSDPGIYKVADLHSGSASPVFKRSGLGHKLEIGQLYNYESGVQSPDNHSRPLQPSNSQSFEDLQVLDGNRRGLQGSQSSPISADKVILKRRSSSNVLPSRMRKAWWKIFLWSHRNLHKGDQIEQGSLPSRSEEVVVQPLHVKEGYSSEPLDVRSALYKTRQGQDKGKLKCLEDDCMLNSITVEKHASDVPSSSHVGWDHPSKVPSSHSYSQWVAFPAVQSNMRRVEEWVSSIDMVAFSHENRDVSDENGIENDQVTEADEGISVGNYIGEISEAMEKLDMGIQGGNLSNEVQLANNAIRSLNAFSTVAHISGIGLSVIPALAPFTSLRLINLSGNSIVRITPGSLPRTLQTLDLSRNKIATIEGLRELTRLRILNLSYNKISRIGHGLASCTLIKELFLTGNKISDVEGLHRLLKLTVLDLSFNKITTLKALGQLAANYNSLLALNLLGNPVHTNVGEEQIRKSIVSLLPHVAYLNKQPIKTVSAREAVVDSVARAALGNSGRYARNKNSRRGNNASSGHRTTAHSHRGNRGSEADRSQSRSSKHIRDRGKSRLEHGNSRRALHASSTRQQKVNRNDPLAQKNSMHISKSEGNLQDFE